MEYSNKIHRIGIKLGELRRNTEHHIGRKLLCDTLIMENCVEIINGKTHIISKNSVVDQGLIALINFYAANNSSPTNFPSVDGNCCRLGSDTTHGTVHTTTLLTTPIGAGIGTAPNVCMGATSNPSAGVFKVLWTCVWFPGTVSGTIGEVGHFLRIDPTLRGFGVTPSPTSYTLFSRMAVADGKFSPVTIDVTYPVVVTWSFTATFAV
jgi:hypothetical protein